MEEVLARAQRLASIGTLATGFAHEINTPLGAISLYAELALRSKDKPDGEAIVEDALRNIQEQALRCGRIVRGVLQFARHEPSEKWPSDLAEVTRQANDITRELAAEKKVSVMLKLDAKLPELVINPTEIEQVLVNLISNAIHASAPGSSVTVRAQPTVDAVRMVVEDRGCGMSEEQVKQAFDPLYTTRMAEGGTGLGLSITYGIVVQHEGTIDVQSSPGKGTTVTLSLPLTASAAMGVGHGKAAPR
jgi:signal transduction histidine kinase